MTPKRNLRRFFSRFTNSFRTIDARTDRESRLREEIAEHIAMATEENIRAGLDPVEARRQAMLKFGGVESMKEDYRDERTFPWFEHLLQDLRFALRMLYKNPGFTVVAVVTLALGIGANAAIFSVVRGVLLRPLANRDEARLLYIGQSAGNTDITFSVPEINDLSANLKSIQAIGTLSSLDFTVVGLGEARTLGSGVVDGNYFNVMGLRPVLGRLIGPGDDGPTAPGVAVLTYKFWSTALHSDPGVIGKTIRLGSFQGTRTATVIGVLQPSVPYPVETELIANIVTSPHHLSATMVTGRLHRMTEVFARLNPDATLEAARAELNTTYAAMRNAHHDEYKGEDNFRFTVTRMHDQINSRANTVLWILLAASGLLFLIACSNVANLFLARTVRREPELALRSALGATNAALRRSLLAEAIVLCGAGLLAGVVIAAPMVGVLSRYASRFSVRAADLTLDSSMLWIGVALAFIATIFLAFIPRLPNTDRSHAFAVSSSGSRVTLGSRRRLRLFAVTQIAACFLLLAGAGALLRTLFVLENNQPPYGTARVLAINLPVMTDGRTPEQITSFYRDVRRRVASLPGVESVSAAMYVPWRDTQDINIHMQFAVDGAPKEDGKDDPRATFRFISPGFFSTLGMPLLEGRDFNDNDRTGSERVIIISEGLAKQFFPGQDPLNRKIHWTDPLLQFSGFSPAPRRIIGVVPEFDDANIIPESAPTIYQPSDQEGFSGRLFVRAKGDPYALMPILTKEIHAMSETQPVERASTLDDVRAEIMAPDRLNAIVFGGFATLALLISIVGVAGVLAFSVSGRLHEFGIRLALGASPRNILSGVLNEGFVIALIGVTTGILLGFAAVRLIAKYTAELQVPGATPLIISAAVILVAALTASAIPAIRAASVDAARALRSE